VRVLIWMLDRIKGRGAAQETPIGFVPTPDALHLEGLDIPRSTLEEILKVVPEEWHSDTVRSEEFFQRIGDRMPAALWKELHAMRERLKIPT
jgi:phosphoenolpyruvate carboxykinase (GTP)